jgi:hemerythrin-like metal-binding protein
MPYPNLPASLQIGVASIDIEHQALVALLDHLIENPDMFPDTTAYLEILSQLGDQLRKHFDNEECFIRSCGLSDERVAAHLAAHDAILEEFVHLNFDRMQDASRSFPETILLIQGWVVDHILNYDLEIRKYATDTE